MGLFVLDAQFLHLASQLPFPKPVTITQQRLFYFSLLTSSFLLTSHFLLPISHLKKKALP